MILQLFACGADAPVVGRLWDPGESAQRGYGLADGAQAGGDVRRVPGDVVAAPLVEVKTLDNFDGVLKEGAVGGKFNSIDF